MHTVLTATYTQADQNTFKITLPYASIAIYKIFSNEFSVKHLN